MAVAVLALVAVAVFGRDGGGDDDDAQPASPPRDNGELISSGPMTPQRAELEGQDDVDFGPDCDPETGRIRLPSVYAPPCVVPFEGDNGGDTAPGVTGDEIVLVRYDTDPALDPLAAAQASFAGADVDPDTATQTVEDYVALYEQVYETYGRHVRVVEFIGSGAGDDPDAARADAIAIADIEPRPFAVIGGPNRMGPVFAAALAEQEILCLGTCPLATPETIVEDNAPFVHPAGATINQNARLSAEMIGKLVGPGPAVWAGDPALRDQERVYGTVHYDNPDGDYEEVTEDFQPVMAEYGIEFEVDISFVLDVNRNTENARNFIAQLKAGGVTTVLYAGDPLMPGALTREATAQGYFPEWILGSTVWADTALFARQYDQQQWRNCVGVSLQPARGEQATGDAFRIYQWAYGTEPPNNTYNALEPSIRMLFVGVHLAGENLTPETFRDGLFRYPPAGGTPTAAHWSLGDHGVWPEQDLGGTDDATLVWWDPDAEGVDEAGNDGVGLYRYANGGERYNLGEFPDSVEEAGLFDDGSSVTIFEELPAEAVPPEYPPPELDG